MKEELTQDTSGGELIPIKDEDEDNDSADEAMVAAKLLIGSWVCSFTVLVQYTLFTTLVSL